MSDHNLKARWASADQRARRKSQGPSEMAPVTPQVDVRVNSSMTEAELRKRLQRTLEEEPAKIFAYWKGVQLYRANSPFQVMFKRIVEEMVTTAQKKTLRKQMKGKELRREALTHDVIRKAVEIFEPKSVEVRPWRAHRPRRRRVRSLMGTFPGV